MFIYRVAGARFWKMAYSHMQCLECEYMIIDGVIALLFKAERRPATCLSSSRWASMHYFFTLHALLIWYQRLTWLLRTGWIRLCRLNNVVFPLVSIGMEQDDKGQLFSAWHTWMTCIHNVKRSKLPPCLWRCIFLAVKGYLVGVRQTFDALVKFTYLSIYYC